MSSAYRKTTTPEERVVAELVAERLGLLALLPLAFAE